MKLSTFGKVILAGEHAVVYGEMALSAKITLEVKARVVEGKKETNPIIKKAIEVAGGNDKIGVIVESEIPIGSGLGSSAAVVAAIIKAVREYLGRRIENDELFELTMECERLAHGNPSGIDPATVVYGGAIAFTKGRPIEKLIIKKPVEMLLVNTGKPIETTKEMVELVVRNTEKEKTIKEIGRIVRQIRANLENGEEIGGLINKNGILLEDLGVVGSGAIRLANELRDMGAMIKITGAGGVAKGSGMMIVIHPDLVKIARVLDNNKIEYYKVRIGDK